MNIQSLFKKFPTLNFPLQSRDPKTAPLCTVGSEFSCLRSSVPVVSSKQSIKKYIQQVFVDNDSEVIPKKPIRHRLHRFESWCTSLESDQHSGKHQTARNAAVAEKIGNHVIKDRRLTVQKISEQVDISTGSLYAISCAERL
ncbi:hypothetical protein TNCV_4441971 [Trichonephila clavipes]|nr:hypothetical protein TNCV_4441971 [Trichonephila clavipes]